MTAHRWGRPESEWEQLVDETTTYLKDCAARQRLTTYSEVNAHLSETLGRPVFDFSSERDRAAIGAVLGTVACEHRAEVGALLSAIVIYLNGNDAGRGFYELAVDEGMLSPRPSADTRTAFWAGQVREVHAHFAG